MKRSIHPTISVYMGQSIPKFLLVEIEALLRAEWPINSEDKNIRPDWEITHHVVLSNPTGVLCYAAIVRKNLSHRSQIYNVIGMSGVITKPDRRGQGYGRKVIEVATNIIKDSDADLALFNTAQKGLYEKFGYERLPVAKMLKGDPSNPQIYPEDVFALFLSKKAVDHRKDFETIPIYFGQRVW